MSDYYCYNEGEQVTGPFSSEQFPELLAKGVVGPETLICPPCPAGQENWQPLKAFPELTQPVTQPLSKPVPTPPPNNEEQSQVDLKAIKEAGTDALPKAVEVEDEDEKEEAGDAASKRKARGRSEMTIIGEELDKLWETQRDSVIARLKGIPLEEESVSIRKHWRESYNIIERYALTYWRRTKQFEKWIKKLTKEEADTVRRLRGSNNQEKYEDVKEWLLKAHLWDVPGTYAFIQDGKYLYAGQATDSLAVRLTWHFKNTLRFFDATHLRIIIPRYKKHVGKVERLLILAYKPPENKMPGDVGNNEADNLLGFVSHEVSELINDG